MPVTPFLNKLRSMVDDRSSDDLIRWSEDGLSFVVLRHEEFAKEVLPRFFKHANFSSFVRQLNMYDFHKVPHLQHGGLISEGPEAESWKFSNEYFQRGQSDLMHFIQRKKKTTLVAANEEASNDDDIDGDGEASAEVTRAAQNGRDKEPFIRANSQRPTGSAQTAVPRTRTSNTPPVTLVQVSKELQVVRDYYKTISSRIKHLEDENQSLWNQARASEERHKQHQKIIDTLVQFLARVFGNGSRQSEIRAPLLRRITDSSGLVKDEDNSSDSDTSAYLGRSQQRSQQQQSNLSSGSATPMVGASSFGSHPQEIFEDMGFAEMLDDAQQRLLQLPPEKRQRLNPKRTNPKHATPERTSRIFEMGSNSSSPESSHTATGGISAAHNVGGSTTPTLRRKAPSTQSTALTRTLHRPIVTNTRPSPQSSNSAVSNALVPVTGTLLGTTETQSKFVEQVKQDIDYFGFSLDDVIQQLQSAVNQNTMPDPLVSTQPSSLGAATATPLTAASAIDPSLQPLPTSEADLDALLTPEVLSSLAMSLAGPGSTLPSHGFDTAMSNGVNGTSMERLSGFQGNPATAAPVYDSRTNTPAVNGNHAAPTGNNVFSPEFIISLLQMCTPEQYETLQHYLNLMSPNNSARAAAPMTAVTHNGVASYNSPIDNVDLTPFLDFADPNSVGDGLAGFDTSGTNFFATDDGKVSSEGGLEDSTQSGGLVDTISVDNDLTKLLFDAFNSDPAISTSTIDALGHGTQDPVPHFGPVAPTSIFANDLVPVTQSTQPTTNFKPN
ncbi:Heat shock transcription factor [Coemansia sp. S155-1]|nr:Heat shock transcription factor [Coemansia sp. S155-1]